jgi:transcriptional regulator with XRE-family HTH domain
MEEKGMSDPRHISHQSAKQEEWKDKEYRRAYRKLKPRYDISKQIIKLRRKLGITQQELANKAGTHQSRISKIESAEFDVRLSTLVQLAEALGAELDIRFVARIDREFVSALNEYVASVHQPAQVVENQEDMVFSTKLYVTTLSQG